jgi:hypothetical protein
MKQHGSQHFPTSTALVISPNPRNSRFITERLKDLFAQEAPDHKRLRLIYYAALLMAFFKNHRLTSKRGALKAVLPVPNPVLEGLLARYTEDHLTSAKEDAKKRYRP